MDARTGRVIAQNVYLPTRVSEAPSDPPGSRVFSASMGRALGKFLPDRQQVKYTKGDQIRKQRAKKEARITEQEEQDKDDD